MDGRAVLSSWLRPPSHSKDERPAVTIDKTQGRIFQAGYIRNIGGARPRPCRCSESCANEDPGRPCFTGVGALLGCVLRVSGNLTRFFSDDILIERFPPRNKLRPNTPSAVRINEQEISVLHSLSAGCGYTHPQSQRQDEAVRGRVNLFSGDAERIERDFSSASSRRLTAYVECFHAGNLLTARRGNFHLALGGSQFLRADALIHRHSVFSSEKNLLRYAF